MSHNILTSVATKGDVRFHIFVEAVNYACEPSFKNLKTDNDFPERPESTNCWENQKSIYFSHDANFLNRVSALYWATDERSYSRNT
jgi:hypothetical protein